MASDNTTRIHDNTIIEVITEDDYFLGTRRMPDGKFQDYRYSMQAVLDYVGSTGGGGGTVGNLVLNSNAGNLILNSNGGSLILS